MSGTKTRSVTSEPDSIWNNPNKQQCCYVTVTHLVLEKCLYSNLPMGKPKLGRYRFILFTIYRRQYIAIFDIIAIN